MKYIIISLVMSSLACQENSQVNNSDLRDISTGLTGDAFYANYEVRSGDSQFDLLDTPIESADSKDIFISDPDSSLSEQDNKELFDVSPNTSFYKPQQNQWINLSELNKYEINNKKTQI